MEATGVKEEVRKFIISNYLRSRQRGALSDSDSFLKKGIVDSIGVIELVQFIQKRFAIDVAVSEIIPDNFDTVNNLERYISRKRKGLSL